MKKRWISQEGLKLLACVTMLIDHLGAVFFLWIGLRIIGRLAFPVYCFLLAEGAAHSRNHGRYCLRLLTGALLAELPFDLLFYGGVTWAHQSVMVTLLLGLVMILWWRKSGDFFLPFVLCFLGAELLHSDYGGWGVALIGLFATTANLAGGSWIQLGGMALIFLAMEPYRVELLGLRIPVQLFGVLAMVPIRLYSGRKLTGSKWLRRAFYLFYPVHLLVLLLIRMYLS